MSEIIGEVFVDKNLEKYQGFIPNEWVESIQGKLVKGTKIDRLFSDLMIEWRATTYTASMPYLTMLRLKGVMEGYARFTSPDSSLIAFGDKIIDALALRLPEIERNHRLKRRLEVELRGLSSHFRETVSKSRVEFSLEEIWETMLDDEDFGFSVWGSQRISFIAFYNAYESFLVGSLKHQSKQQSLKTSQPKFKDLFKEHFGEQLFEECWNRTGIDISRLIRHALSHFGGRMTADLRNKSSEHKLEPIDDVIQITPVENHILMSNLRRSVAHFIEAAVRLPRFRSTQRK